MDKTLRTAFYRIVKALMRILYRKGVALGDFTLLVKQAYVEVVEQELQRAGERVTTSRIAAITGLTRKDVAVLRECEGGEISQRYNRGVRVLTGWLHDPEFVDAHTGQPAVLPFRGEQGSFERLVQRYSGDMSSFAMLEEMKRIQVVAENADGTLMLLSPVYVPQCDEGEKVALLGLDVPLLINTIDHNLTTDNPENVRYQRKVSYDNLPQEVLPEFRAFVQRDAQQLLLRFNAWLYQHDRDSNPEIGGTGRMQAGVGIYYFEQPVNTNKDVKHED
ncbi:DUF6502 family protein [Thiothrix subterranea]|uniref:DUF6502 family protein n=1 Tax=Thiothrix subterranea TaxID=2735563 RepID=A0AA51MQM2_9GAMM|nr:DUF6502 family protein [Thiothrix subterranea]MDQ5770518.1 DUF6502 family protein [Thiothrix subterranea]WML87476.1 DUF6502 family protein [Thiothrix subterranea]